MRRPSGRQHRRTRHRAILGNASCRRQATEEARGAWYTRAAPARHPRCHAKYTCSRGAVSWFAPPSTWRSPDMSLEHFDHEFNLEL